MSDDIDIREGSPEGRPPRVPPVSGMRLAVIQSGPHAADADNAIDYFTVKFAYYNTSTGATPALPGAVAFNVPAVCVYHRDTLIDDDPDYTQPRLSGTDPLWIAQDYPGGTWLVVGHFRPSTTTCPEA